MQWYIIYSQADLIQYGIHVVIFSLICAALWSSITALRKVAML